MRVGTDGRDLGGAPPAPRARDLSDNTRGALFMMASMLGFSVNDALLKSVADDLPLSQAVFLRGLVDDAR